MQLDTRYFKLMSHSSMRTTILDLIGLYLVIQLRLGQDTRIYLALLHVQLFHLPEAISIVIMVKGVSQLRI